MAGTLPAPSNVALLAVLVTLTAPPTLFDDRTHITGKRLHTVGVSDGGDEFVAVPATKRCWSCSPAPTLARQLERGSARPARDRPSYTRSSCRSRRRVRGLAARTATTRDLRRRACRHDTNPATGRLCVRPHPSTRASRTKRGTPREADLVAVPAIIDQLVHTAGYALGTEPSWVDNDVARVIACTEQRFTLQSRRPSSTKPNQPNDATPGPVSFATMRQPRTIAPCSIRRLDGCRRTGPCSASLRVRQPR